MIRLLELLFDGKKPVSVSAAVGMGKVDSQREHLTRELREIDKSYQKINVETKKMKKRIDTALAIAISTGGLNDK